MAGPLLDFRRVVPSLLARMPDVTEARVVSRPTLKSADGLDTPNCPPLQHWLRGYVSLAYSLHNEKPSGTESLTARPRLWLGADLSNHNHVTGGIGEAIVYPAAHSGTERKAIEEVLMQRWRIKPRAAMADPSARPQAAGNTVFFRAARSSLEATSWSFAALTPGAGLPIAAKTAHKTVSSSASTRSTLTKKATSVAVRQAWEE